MPQQIEIEIKPLESVQEETSNVGWTVDPSLCKVMSGTAPMMTTDEVRSYVDGENQVSLKTGNYRMSLYKSSEGYGYGISSSVPLDTAFCDTDDWEELMNDLHQELIDSGFTKGLHDIFTVMGVDLEDPALLSKYPSLELVREWAARAKDGSVEHQALIVAHIELGKSIASTGDHYGLERLIGGSIVIYEETLNDSLLCSNDGSIDGVLEESYRQYFQDRYEFVAQIFQQI